MTTSQTTSRTEVARIIFWQPIDSPHQDAFLESVAEGFDGDVILGYEQPFPAERAAQGWRAPRHARVKVFDISSSANHAALAAHDTEESLHVFSGFFCYPLVQSAFRVLAPSRAHLAIYSEAPEQPLLIGWLKHLRGRFIAARWASRIGFVLAVGGLGCDFFTRIGFPSNKIVPFGYYDQPPAVDVRDSEVHRDGVFHFISAGQLIRRKGIDLLLRACARLPSAGWHLDIYGDGPKRRSLEHLASRLHLKTQVTFHGKVPHTDLQRAIAAADCAILPSRFDGWGMLVSEAVAVGTPVICTSCCGSSDLATRSSVLGVTVAPSPRQLAEPLSAALKAGLPTPDIRAAIARTMTERGSAKAAAGRVLAAVRSLRERD